MRFLCVFVIIGLITAAIAVDLMDKTQTNQGSVLDCMLLFTHIIIILKNFNLIKKKTF